MIYNLEILTQEATLQTKLVEPALVVYIVGNQGQDLDWNWH